MASFGWGSHNHVHYACRSVGENVFSISLEPNGNEKQEVHPTGKSSGEGCVCVCVWRGGGGIARVTQTGESTRLPSM